jgi:hypothetical protein
MFPLKKEGSKIYMVMLVGHDVPSEDLAEGILWWTMSNDHYFHVKNIQAAKRWTASGLHTLHRTGSHRPAQMPS